MSKVLHIKPLCTVLSSIRLSHTTYFHTIHTQQRNFSTETNNPNDLKHKYANTLNLPQTKFSIRSNALEREPSLRVDVVKLYKWQQNNNEAGNTWVTHDGPPYANGDLHLGHALNKILKDIVNRYKMLRGNQVFYVPGWDCHGLPIELKALEKNKNKDNIKQTPQEIRKTAKMFAETEFEKQRNEFKSWGIMGDWDEPYLTMNKDYEAAELRIFSDLFSQGLIYRSKYPVHWSPSSQTALADAELVYKDDHTSLSIFVSFKVTSSENEKIKQFIENNDKNLFALIWTTTPWSIPGNLAICVNSETNYTIVKASEEGSKYFIVATSIISRLRQTLKLPLIETGISFLGKDLVGVNCVHPLFSRNSPIITGDHVTDEDGTGLVHTAPGHGPDDFAVAQKYKLDILCPVDNYGKYTIEAGERLFKKSVLSDGNTEVIQMLTEKDALIFQNAIQHRYPYDWRTNKPVIIRTTPQWFINLQKLSEDAVNALKSVQMIPHTERLASTVTSRSQWCISRQRVWGVPIPVFYEEETGEPLINTEIIDHIKSIVEEKGSDCWWEMSVDELLPKKYQNSNKKYVKGTDTMDVWFDSGVSWNSVLGEKKRGGPFPADLYLEGSDQHRGWFQSSLLTAIASKGKAPYKTILTHGFSLDEKGVKMSKSAGNVIAPSIVILGGKNKTEDPAYGVDVLRITVCSSDFSKDVSFGRSVFSKAHETIKKIRNTLRFALSNLYDFDETKHIVPYSELLEVDRFILHNLYSFVSSVTKSYDTFNFSKVQKDALIFSNVDLSAFYFDIIKQRLYTDSPQAHRRRSSQTALYHIATIFSLIISPITPHLSEDVHIHLTQRLNSEHNQNSTITLENTIFKNKWPSVSEEWNQNDLSIKWKVIQVIRDSVNCTLEVARIEKLIGRAEETTLVIYLSDTKNLKINNENLFESLRSMNDELSDVFLVSGLELRDLSLLVTPSEHCEVKNNVKIEDGSEGKRFVFYSELTENGKTLKYAIETTLAKSEKCLRCWRYTAKEKDSICKHCEDALASK